MHKYYYSLFLLILLSPCFSTKPTCYLDGQKCGLDSNNLLEWEMDIDIDQCRQNCIGNYDCSVFTHFGQNSSPFQNACLLLSSCPSYHPCEDCVTESVKSCLCSLPYECHFSAENLHGIVDGVPYEDACKQLCDDTNECSTYTYYDEDSLESPRLCVLLKGCDKLFPEPCLGCHTGPQSCSNSSSEGGECQFAVWSNLEVGLLATESQTVRLLSGEPNCYKEVRALAVGGGGGTSSYRAGGAGSGYVNMVVVTKLMAHVDHLVVSVGSGGAQKVPASASVVTYLSSGETLIRGEAGQSVNSETGGDGYSGGGAQEANGGANGGPGDIIGNVNGGNGSAFSLTDFNSMHFDITPGKGGLGNSTAGGGGGGGGVVIDGESPPGNVYQGEGFCGGTEGVYDTSGLPGCVLLEV